jgi:DNA-binding response OmpR family regulator
MPNILVVEDDTALRETLAYNLSRQDYSVQAVGDGITGMEVARKIHTPQNKLTEDYITGRFG